MKWVLVLVLLMGCGETIVQPADVYVDLDEVTNIYDGEWKGRWLDAGIRKWDMHIKIGKVSNDGSRALGGEVILIDTRFTMGDGGPLRQSYVIEHTEIIVDEQSLQATITSPGLWDMWCYPTAAPDTLRCRMSHWINEPDWVLARHNSLGD